jgi:phosphoribosylformimino-5-aminoimidazole carboxamide ribotide isomerase
MNIIPAIDLMDGGVVRLMRGDSKTVTSYQQFGTPRKVAEKWEREGAKAIHIVDLDAAKSRGDNTQVVKTIIQSVGIPIQLGGGIRTRQRAEEMFSLGVTRIIFGTLAFEKPKKLISILTKYGKDRVMVALDYLNDQVMILGWKTTTKFTLQEALTKFLTLGVENFLLTSISKDGLLTGPDCITLRTVVNINRTKIYAAGGISSLSDLRLLKNVGVVGVVVGKALYEGKFTLKEAIQITKIS